jgi:glutamate synthase (NADPH/NADH) small chain
VVFKTSTFIGQNLPTAELVDGYDVICLTGGSTVPRDLNIPGRDFQGVHFAMEYLTQQNRLLDGLEISRSDKIDAKDKNVIILGGGDTGADCLGTAHRQGARSVKQFEIMPEPPVARDQNNPWPEWPRILMTSAAHEEGGTREYNISTQKFTGDNGIVRKLHGIKVYWDQSSEDTRPTLKEIKGSEFEIQADLILLAMGFLHPERTGMLDDLQVALDSRGNVATDQDKMTNIPGIFSAGDMTRGQSLVVWAIAEGREVARGIDRYLTGNSNLPKVLTN